MAVPQQIQATLETLKAAFPEKTHSKATLELYYRYLADIPNGTLERTVDELVRTSQWFPRIAEVRQVASRYAGTDNYFEATPRFPDQLAARALQLERDYYHTGVLEEEAWRSLALQFERQGRAHRAAHTRLKLERLLANGSFEQAGEVIEHLGKLSIEQM